MNTSNPNFKKVIEQLNEKKRKLTVKKQSYWETLAPNFPISPDPFKKEFAPYSIDQQEIEQSLAQLKQDGYFVTAPIIPAEDLALMKDLFLRVKAKGHRPAYSFLYDCYYEIIQRLSNLLTPILGKDYQIILDEPGAFFVDNKNNSAGSPPHRDSVTGQKTTLKNGLPTLLNIWIPITDATTSNGCMHLLPQHLDPFWQNEKPVNVWKKKFDWDEVRFLMQKGRAIPSPAGSIVGWNSNTLHWGGYSSDFATEPRISISVYFQNATIPPYHPFTTKMDSELPFDYRLYLVEKLTHDRKLKKNTFQRYQQLWEDHYKK